MEKLEGKNEKIPATKGKKQVGKIKKMERLVPVI